MAGRSGSSRRSAVTSAIASIGLLALAGTAANAQTAYCRQLQGDYSAADRSTGSDGNLSRLRRDLAKTESLARSKGCKRFLFFGPKRSGQCPQIMSRLNSLQGDINRASRGGWGSVGKRNSSVHRARLRDMLVKNGCSVPGSSGVASAGYRTLCVRACDGYYFPVSNSAGRSRFNIDEAVCKAFYGNAEAELYIQSSSGSVENARSLTGEPYIGLENALAFRASFDPSCQAELHAGLKAIAEVQKAQIAQREAEQTAHPDRVVPIPVARVNATQDPETLANLAGNFTVEPVAPTNHEPDLVAAAGGTDIRRIGPDYYYSTPITLEGLKRERWRAPELSFVGTASASERAVEDAAAPGLTAVR